VSFLRTERIDIAVFSEVNGASRRSQGVDQVALVAEGGGLAHRQFFPTHVVGERVNQGNAVCARFPVRWVADHRLPGIGEPRHLSEAEVRIGGVAVRVLATHLALDFGQRARQIHRIAAVVGDGDPRPTILAGDFNVSHEEEMELLVDTKLQMATSAATYPAWRPRRRLDYLFFSEEFRIVESHAYRKTLFSDHLPLVAEVEMLVPGALGR
jgi:endonuclease/exonuclease/phosphatase family metal-dependent hydrolase